MTIQHTLSFLIEERKKRVINTVLIFSDSQSAVGIADMLKEAEEVTDDAGVANKSDVKSATREFFKMKWQRR